MARAAGLQKEVCQIIASAAQFVDDNHEEHEIEFKDGGKLNVMPTAYSLFSEENMARFDKEHRRVWVPFHFLPGNKGKGISERLICRQDSRISREMLNHCVSRIQEPFGLHILGIAAHVYADTFAHYGFSGVSSRWNEVHGGSIELNNDERDGEAEKRFEDKHGHTMKGLPNWRTVWDEVKSETVEFFTGALGHGAVLKYPDFPYLEWEFEYEHTEDTTDIPRRTDRNNLETYLEACRKLYELFSSLPRQFKDSSPAQATNFTQIEGFVRQILEVKEPSREERSKIWKIYAKKGKLFTQPEDILPYRGNLWKQKLKKLNRNFTVEQASKEHVIKFLQAAEIYRTYVLKELLPKHNLILD
ncbi:MAG: hypothetical protein OXC62_13340 [Aestuariivita sp.]|nr:hypothetical protein [Aestuariivita sp.]